MSTLVPPPWLVQPLAPADFDLPGSLPDPGFTQLVNDTLDDLGTSADGVDQDITDVLGIIDAFGSALDEQDNALDAVLTALAATDTTPADNAFNDYTATFPAGDALVAGAQELAVPQLGPLEQAWFSPAVVPAAPPTGGGVQVPGQVTVGDPAFTFKVTRSIDVSQGGTVTGVRLVNPNAVITAAELISVSAPYFNPNPPGGHAPGNFIDVVIGIDIHPVQAGVFQVVILFDGLPTALAGVEIGVDVHPKP